jgi:hypothetical protein
MIAGMNFAARSLLMGGAGTAVAGAAWRGMGAAGRTATVGAGIGGLYGAFANDTSVIGGAMMGAGIGLAGRYGRAGLRSANRALGPKGSPTYDLGSAFMGGIGRRFMRDVRGPSMLANQGFNKIRSTLKGWL